MKKIIGFAAIIAAAVVFAYTYRLQTVAYLQMPVMAVADQNAARILKSGLAEGEDGTIRLNSYTDSETLTRRGNQFYLGDDRDKVDVAVPLYTPDGTSLYYLGDSSRLIASDFASFASYGGLVVSDGAAFDLDGMQVDEEEYIMSTAGAGLFVNLQPMEIQTPAGEISIRMNSMLNLMDDAVRYYEYEDGFFLYGEGQVPDNSQVTVGSVTMTYQEFLIYMGLASQAVSSTGEENIPLSPLPEIPERDDTDREESGREPDRDSEGEAVSDGDAAAGRDGASGQAPGDDLENEDGTGQETAGDSASGMGGGDAFGGSGSPAAEAARWLLRRWRRRRLHGSSMGGGNAGEGGGTGAAAAPEERSPETVETIRIRGEAAPAAVPEAEATAATVRMIPIPSQR
ncbi:MAG: hypothetical protein ACLTKI_00200 [Lachnospiraceae bacterium]